jgi:hypothetical protein
MSEQLESSEAEYLERKRKIRADASLSWEKKELKIRKLGKHYDQLRKEGEGGRH